MADRLGKHLRRLYIEPLEDRRMLAVVTVDTELDVVDVGDGLTSLREAIFATNALLGADTIEFDLSLSGKTILLTQGELQITDDVTINGLGKNYLTIDASGSDSTPGIADGLGSRVFGISDNDAENSIDVALFGLTITGGDVAGNGGGVFSQENLTITSSAITGNAANRLLGVSNSGRGGGIWSQGILTIADSSFSSNSAGDGISGDWRHGGSGGGIWTEGTTLITGSTITLNQAGNSYPYNQGHGGGGGRGGGIHAAGNTTISTSTISGNSSGSGGGAQYLRNGGSGGAGGGIRATGTLSVDHSTFTGNDTGSGGGVNDGHGGDGGDGGGISVNGTLLLTQSTVSGNSTGQGGGVSYGGGGRGGHGGGIAVEGSATFVDSLISGNNTGKGGRGGTPDRVGGENAAGGSGGGISLDGSGAKTITNSTISENTTGQGGADGRRSFAGDGGDGGGIFVGGTGSLIIAHSTLTGNATGVNGPHHSGLGYGGGNFGEGGGIFASVGLPDVVLSNSIVAGNVRGVAPETPSDDDLQSPGSFAVNNSLIGVDTGATIVDNGGNFIGTSGASIDPLLGPLQNNGGPTETHALLLGSPAIDMGDPAAVAGVGDVPLADQRGGPYMRVYGGRIDIGAFEAQTALADFDGDHDVDGRDFLAWQRGSGTSAPNAQKADGDADGDLDVDANDLAIWKLEYGFQQSEEIPSLVVTTELDVVDLYDELVSLREAIAYANGLTTDDTIEFDLSLSGKTILLTQGELQITDDVTINGLGKNYLTIDASGSDSTPGIADGLGSRVFGISDNDAENSIDVALFGLTITGGDVAGNGGGVFSQENLTITSSAITGNAANRLLGVSGSGRGGGIWSQGNLTIADSSISSNSAGDGISSDWRHDYHGGSGGGIWTEGTTLITGSTITLNQAGNSYPYIQGHGGSGGRGGGIHAAGNTTISTSTISGNSSGSGGRAQYASNGGSGGAGGGIRATGTLSIDHSTITGNDTGCGGNAAYYGDGGDGGDGGGISVKGTLLLTQSTVSGNSTGYGGDVSYGGGGRGGNGGGIAVEGSATFVDSLISGNNTGEGGGGGGGFATGGSGGGISLDGSGAKAITNSTISGNTTGQGGADGRRSFAGDGGDGGGIFVGGTGSLNIAHSTLTGNATGVNGPHHSGLGYGGGNFGEGGGIFASVGLPDVVLSNSIVAGNFRGVAPETPSDDDLQSPGSFAVNNSLIGVDTGATIVDNGGNFIGTSGASIDPLLGPLQNNGGPTFTHALLPGSPAIDMGDPAAVAGVGDVPLADQRGGPYMRVYGGRIDIGAFESQALPANFVGVDLAGAAYLLNSGIGIWNAESADVVRDGEVVRDEVFALLDDSLRQDEDAAVVLAGEHLVDLTEDLAERDLAHERLQSFNDVPLGGELFPNL